MIRRYRPDDITVTGRTPPLFLRVSGSFLRFLRVSGSFLRDETTKKTATAARPSDFPGASFSVKKSVFCFEPFFSRVPSDPALPRHVVIDMQPVVYQVPRW